MAEEVPWVLPACVQCGVVLPQLAEMNAHAAETGHRDFVARSPQQKPEEDAVPAV